ncbi:MAG TPA: RNA polymerase sigma factor [Burkholderiales bacterium]
MDREPSDEALMLRYRDGDAGAFEALYGRHRGPLFRYFLRQWRDRAAAEEMFQDVWTGVIRSRARYQPAAKFTTWLYRMAHNRLMDEYRRGGERQPVSFDDPEGGVADPPAPPGADPAREAENREQAALLLVALEALPEAQREAFLLHQEGGLTLEEIAAATGVGFETAKSRLRYAVARLRQALGG